MILILKNTTANPIAMGTLSIAGMGQETIYTSPFTADLKIACDEVKSHMATFNAGILSGDLVLNKNAADLSAANAYAEWNLVSNQMEALDNLQTVFTLLYELATEVP
jgi:hypothetical protein